MVYSLTKSCTTPEVTQHACTQLVFEEESKAKGHSKWQNLRIITSQKADNDNTIPETFSFSKFITIEILIHQVLTK